MNGTTPAPLSDERLAEIRGDHNAYVARHAHAGAFACCSAHTGADAVPELLAEIQRLRDERDDDLCVMVAFLRPNGRGEVAWTAILANHFGPRAQELIEDSGRFAAAYSRVNQIPPITIKPGPGCDHGPEWQCVECVPEDGFSFQPLGAEESAR